MVFWCLNPNGTLFLPCELDSEVRSLVRCDRFESAFVSAALSVVRDTRRGVDRLQTTSPNCLLQSVDPSLFISYDRKSCRNKTGSNRSHLAILTLSNSHGRKRVPFGLKHQGLTPGYGVHHQTAPMRIHGLHRDIKK